MSARPRTHILQTFDEALNVLRSDVVMMASLTERILSNAMTGLLDRDDELCNVAIADDEEIDQLEIQVDKDGIEVLLRFQPVAADLRQVVSAMKLSSNIERIADQAVNIARRARKLNRDPRLNEAAMVEPMYHHAFAMFHDAIDAYVRSDTVMARGMKTRDRELDEMNRHLSKELTECMSKDTPRLEGYLALLFIGRHLERVGDHATNMAEDAVFAVAAEDIRHNGASRLSSGTT